MMLETCVVFLFSHWFEFSVFFSFYSTVVYHLTCTGFQQPPLDNCSAASCHFGVLAGEHTHMCFYSTILPQLVAEQPSTGGCWILHIQGQKWWEYWTTLPASWVFCMQVKKQQSELDMEQQHGYKLGKGYIKAVYCHPAYLTYYRVHHVKFQARWSTSWN